MPDVLGYLQAKGVPTKQATRHNVHTHCFFCSEEPSARGRLYINTDPDAEVPGLYKCFRCDAKGNLTTLKRHFGDEVGEVELDSHIRYEILRFAAVYYHELLGRYPDVEAYLKGPERGLLPETIEGHEIGYAPMDVVWDVVSQTATVRRPRGLYSALRDATFAPKDILATGLCQDTKSGIVDALYGMVTIPYHSAGNCVAIRGRAWPFTPADFETWTLDRYDPPPSKYKTPGGTSTRLFNTDSAWTHQEVVVTEGEFDALVVEQAGFASLGVPGANVWQPEWDDYLTPMKRVFLVFDRDPAGEKGAKKLEEQFSGKVRRVFLSPEGVKCDPTVWFQTHTPAEFADLLAEASKGGLLVSVHDAITEFRAVQSQEGLRFGWEGLDVAFRPGLQPSQLLVLLARTGAGKGHPLDTEVPTPEGLRRWGDLVVGDEVYGSDGKPTKVVGVYDRGRLPTYRVSFSDGTSVVTDADHIWTVRHVTGHTYGWHEKDMTTAELAAADLKNRRAWRYTIPMCRPVTNPEQEFPIEPYTLGALIANGSLTGSSTNLSTPDSDVAERVARHYDIHKINRAGDVCDAYIVRKTIGRVRALGLAVHSAKKFIPSIYFQGSIDQRVALLQGLMDGDGCSSAERGKRNSRYFTSSPQLADDVIRLVTSLGGTATQSWCQRGDAAPEGRLSIMLPDDIQPFSSQRKNLPVAGHRYRTETRRAIVAIEPLGEDEIRCIAVDAPDSLYLIGRHHIVTHNTLFLLNMMHRARMVEGQEKLRFLFVSLEQTRGEWWDRARRIYRFYNLDHNERDAQRFWQNNLMLVDRNRVNENELRQVLDDYAYQMGAMPDLVCLDYIGYWARAFRGEAYERTSAAVMKLKEIIKEYRVPMIAPHQVSRSARDGEEFQAEAARDSGAVEETADFILTMWRPEDAQGRSQEERDGVVNFKVAKSRHGGRGAELAMQWSPVSLVLVPELDPLRARAQHEVVWKRRYGNRTWEELMLMHEGNGR